MVHNNLIHLRSIGIECDHPLDFTIDRPHGSGTVVFIQFASPVELDQSGTRVIVPAGGCILYTPPFRQWYRGHKTGLVDHWLHAEPKPMLKDISDFKLPVNTPFELNESGWVRALLEEIEREQARREPHWEEAVSLLVRRLLLQLSRQRSDTSASVLTPHKSELINRFRDVRQEMHSDPGGQWTVPDMADKLHLSESRFAVLYREFFGIAPKEDLIGMRLTRAKSLLTNTALPVGKVASQCGFESIYHFSRLFRRRVGCPPSEYYRTRVIA